MIIDLDQELYIVDNRTHEHKVRFIDDVAKIVYAEGTDNCDGIAKITIEANESEADVLSNITKFQALTTAKKNYYLSDTFKDLPRQQQLNKLNADITGTEEEILSILDSILNTKTTTLNLGMFYYSTHPLTVMVREN